MWAATEAIGRLTSMLEEQRLGKKLDLCVSTCVAGVFEIFLH
jgi:hypothetical protein